MKVYSISVPGAVGGVDGLFCWDEQLRNTIAVANDRMSLLKRDSGGMGGSLILCKIEKYNIAEDIKYMMATKTDKIVIKYYY